MLGRLLAKNVYQEGSSVADDAAFTAPFHLHEEARLKLFGSRDVEQQISPHQFRVLVAQDLGELMSRHSFQVALDYCNARGSAMDQISANELRNYIFGSAVRTIDPHQSDKFRVLSDMGVLLVMRVFPATGNGQRLAMCLCLPESYATALSEVWSYVTRWLDECRELATTIVASESVKPLPRNIGVQASQSSEAIISSVYKLLVPVIASHTEIPRLFLYPNTCSEYIVNWFQGIFHWLEIKDGHRLKFLPVLLAKVALDFSDQLVANEACRIVIMSGNMVVANKLIFILAGMLKPRYKGCIHTCDQITHGSKQKTDNTPHEEESLHDARQFTTVTNQGWKIPRQKESPYSSTSLSSDESSAQVIQPSSFKSGGSSLVHLSSSLSSAYGSYGSWFNKRATVNSPSKNGNGFLEPSLFLQRNNSSSSLHQIAMNNRITPLPSPSLNEYEDFPWLATPMSPRTEHSNSDHFASAEPAFHTLNLKRNCNRITDSTEMDEIFENLCVFDASQLSMSTPAVGANHAPVLEVNFEEDYKYDATELLPKYTAYVPNLVPWFQLQAIPISSDAERKVLGVMKRDLHNCHVSRTLFVSLRSREIREIMLEKDKRTHKLVQRTKKIFNSGKCTALSPRFQQALSFFEAKFREALDIWESSKSDEDKKNSLTLIYRQLQLTDFCATP